VRRYRGSRDGARCRCRSVVNQPAESGVTGREITVQLWSDPSPRLASRCWSSLTAYGRVRRRRDVAELIFLWLCSIP
jgi:hypothetical protein